MNIFFVCFFIQFIAFPMKMFDKWVRWAWALVSVCVCVLYVFRDHRLHLSWCRHNERIYIGRESPTSLFIMNRQWRRLAAGKHSFSTSIIIYWSAKYEIKYYSNKQSKSENMILVVFDRKAIIINMDEQEEKNTKSVAAILAFFVLLMVLCVTPVCHRTITRRTIEEKLRKSAARTKIQKKKQINMQKKIKAGFVANEIQFHSRPKTTIRTQ